MRPIETKCENCTLFNNNKCDLGRIEIFLKNNQGHKTPDGNYIISRVCNTFVDKRVHTEEIHKDSAKIREMIKTKFDLIVFINAKSDTTEILDKIEQLNYHPKHVYLVSKEKINAIKAIQHAKNKSFKMDLRYIFEDKAIDLLVSKCEGDYICYTDNINLIPQDYFANIDKYLNDKLERFVMINPLDDINGFVIYKKAFQAFLGNQGENIITKIQNSALENDQQGMIRDYVEFTNSSDNRTS